MHPTTARVAAALRQAGVETEIREFEDATRTAQQAAEALGVQVGAIVKSLCFVADDHPVMVLVSGANRADTAKIQAALGAMEVRRADAELVRAATGFAIGGVPPIAHVGPLRLIVDRDLMSYDELWAAAGTPHSVFRISPPQLLTLTGAELADIAEEPRP
jgi:prolyl-tRNA editing enzyme YbaK/EbsC (Cys-tRNA(Pro) deacylase)